MVLRRIVSIYIVIGMLVAVAGLLAIPTAKASGCGGANRFWVGGTGVWSSTTHWSTASGGASGASVPDATNPVIFDASSGAGTATIDVTASSCDVTATGMSLTTIAMGAQTWKVYGDMTDLEGTKITINTSTLELAGAATQTIGLGVSSSNFNIYNLVISGAGTKVINNRFYVQGASWSATTSVTMQFKPDLTESTAAVFTLQAAFTIGATAGNVLTMQSKILGSRWSLHPSAGGSLEAFLLRVSIQDATATMGTGKFIDGTDWSVSDLGGNSNIQFTPKSSVVDPQASPGLSVDYGPQVFRNLNGDLIVSYGDGNVNNGNWYVTYSTNNGQSWATRTTLMSPTSGGILTASTGAGQEIYGYADKRDVLHIINHKLIGGITHLIYTQVDISTASNVAQFSKWASASGRSPPSLGNAVDGQGFDDLGGGSDASLAVLSDGTVVLGIDTSDAAAGPMAVQVYHPQTNTYSARATLPFSGSPTQLAIVVSDGFDNLHFFTAGTVGGVTGILYLRCNNAVSTDCSQAGNWRGAGGGSNDQVIFSASGSFGFPFAMVDKNNIVHISSTSQFAVAGFCRVWHNYLLPGSTTWANGAGASGGAEINGAAAYPTRTRPVCAVRNGYIMTDSAGNAYVLYADQQLSMAAYHKFNGGTRTWGDQITTMYTGLSPHGVLHTRNGQSVVDILSFDGTVGAVTGLRWQGIGATLGTDAWWDFLISYGTGSGTIAPSFVYGPHLTLLDAFSDNLVYFQDNSLIPASLAPATYIWDFGDGSYAKGSAVSHNYNYSLVATFTVKLLICGGPPGAIQCYTTTRSVTLFQWHILAVALFILGSAAGSLYAIAYYARHARLPPRGFVTKRVVYWMRR